MKFVVSASTFLAASWLLALNKASVVVASLDENVGNNNSNNNNNMNMNVLKERDLTANVQQQGRRKTSFVGSREEGRIPRQEGYGPSGGVEGPMGFEESSSVYYGSEPQDQDVYLEQQGVMYYDPQEEGQRPRQGFGPSGSEQGPMEQDATTTGGGLRGYGATTSSAGEEDYHPMMIPGSFEAAAVVPPQKMKCPDSAIMVIANSDNNRNSKNYQIVETFANGDISITTKMVTEPYSMELICVKSDSCVLYAVIDSEGFADASVSFNYFDKAIGDFYTDFQVNKGTVVCGEEMKCVNDDKNAAKVTGKATYQFGTHEYHKAYTPGCLE